MALESGLCEGGQLTHWGGQSAGVVFMEMSENLDRVSHLCQCGAGQIYCKYVLCKMMGYFFWCAKRLLPSWQVLLGFLVRCAFGKFYEHPPLLINWWALHWNCNGWIWTLRLCSDICSIHNMGSWGWGGCTPCRGPALPWLRHSCTMLSQSHPDTGHHASCFSTASHDWQTTGHWQSGQVHRPTRLKWRKFPASGKEGAGSCWASGIDLTI